MPATRSIRFLKRSGVLFKDASTPRVTIAYHYWKYVVQFTAVFAAYFIAGRLGQATTDVRSNNLGPVWPAYGVALAAILLCGYRIWPAVALGVFVIAFLSPESYLTALGQTSGSTAAALIGTFLLRHIAKLDNSLSRLRDGLALILLGAFGSAIVSASIGTLVLHASHIHSYAGLGSAWLIYWLGDSTGVLLVTPLVLTFPNLLRIRNWVRLAEFICLLTILVAICAIVFGDLAIVPVRMIAFAVLPLVVWAAFRFGVSGAALSIFLVATVATVQTALGSGSFASNTPFMNGVQLDVFFAVLSLTGLTFAAVYAERELAQREREQSLREQVGMEVRLQNQELLRESEEKFRSVFRDAGVGMVIVSPEGRFLATNSTFCDILGYTEEELLEKTVESVTFPEDWPAFSQKLREALTDGCSFQWFEKRSLHKSGRIVYTETSASLIRARNGEPQYFVGEVSDITKRKEAEEALSDMTRKLVQAQEQERARIARELHDDINQRLALLTFELEQLKQNPSEVESRAQELRKQTIDISNDVQALSHDLHSSQLEYLGAVAGMRSWCKQFAERQKMEIEFKSGVPSVLPFEVGLCLFRVLQEALHNASKHSGVKRVAVQIEEHSNEVHLIVNDSGKGFDVETASQGKGLGLTSMRERVRLVNGTISIESKPMGGTTIHVRVPLESRHAAKQEAV